MEMSDYGSPKINHTRAATPKMLKRAQECPSCAKNAKYYFTEFSDKTGMHGFNLLVERKRTVPERIWWAVVIIAAFALCIAMVVQTTKRWINFPVTVTFATSQTLIHEVPFPAITICPDVKAHSAQFNYTEIFLKKANNKTLTPKEIKEFDYLSLICGAPSEFFDNLEEFTNESAIEFIRKVAPDFFHTFFEVIWSGDSYEDQEMTDLFHPIFTSEGVCYTFNMMDRSEIFTDVVVPFQDFFSTNGKHSDWSLDQGYAKDSPLDPYPQRTLSAGLKSGLTLYLRVSHDDLDYACADFSQGFKVMLHSPAEIPRAKQDYFRIPLDQSVVGAIKPKITTTSEDLISYSPEKRQCYFATEKSLKFFKIYNQANCLIECLRNFTLQTCGCIGFYMPRENSSLICGAAKMDCLEEARAIFIENEVTHKNQMQQQVNAAEKCNCLPSCSSLEFSIEISQSEWEWKERMLIEKHTRSWTPEFEPIFTDSHLSHLSLFFKDMQFVTAERNELYSQIDFWANIGGVLGLFTGFTFISACEVLYYLSLRLCCNIRKYGRHYWSGSEKLLMGKEHMENKIG